MLAMMGFLFMRCPLKRCQNVPELKEELMRAAFLVLCCFPPRLCSPRRRSPAPAPYDADSPSASARINGDEELRARSLPRPA